MRLPGVGDGTVVRTFDAPEAMGINFHEVRARSALNHVPGGRYGFSYTVNSFRGCSHACAYCFARRTHTFLDFNAGRDFEREIVVKVNVPELLRAELARPSWKRELVAMGTNTDPYQWVESRYRFMPEILAALEAAETPVSVLTKSPLALRDIDLYEQMAKRLPVSVNLSVPTLDEEAWRATEPHTPSPSARLDAVAELRSRGIDSGVLIAPLMPGINDSPEQVQPIVDRAREAGATFLGGVALHLRDEVRDVFFAWLEAKRPDLLPRYEQLYANGRANMRPEQRKQVSSAVRGWGRRRSPAPTRGPSARSEYPPVQGTADALGQDALF
jgi:DNA repair photolyase